MYLVLQIFKEVYVVYDSPVNCLTYDLLQISYFYLSTIYFVDKELL